MVPVQRPDVQTFVDPRGLIVYDPHTGLRVLLGPESTLLWDALSGGVGSPATLIHATPELSDAQRFVRLMQLDQALLLVSPRWRRQEHLFHARAKAVDSPLYVHPRLTHECVKCGSSCQEIHVGPITPLTAASIRSNDLWRSDPNATKAEDILFTAEVQKKSVLMLKQVNGRCAVWSHDRGCTIHATSGHKLKPIACQQYPYTMIRTTKGVYVGLQMTCRSLPQSLEAGASYRPTEIAQRLAPIVMSGGQTFTLPAPSPLSAGSYIPESALEEWWRWAVQIVEQTLGELELGNSEYSVNDTWKKVMEKLTLYVHEWLLRIDESGESSQWLDPQTWLFQSSLPTRTEVKLSFIDELQYSLLEAAMQHQQEQRWQEMKRLERLYEAVEVWSGRWPIHPPRWRGDQADKLMNLAILEGVYSHRLFLQGDLIYGLAHLQLTLELTESLMRLSAHLSSRMVIETSEVNDALVLVNRALREPAVDATLKRWAGGLRWMMSPEGMPYRHSLGTLEPHLFKLQTHLTRNRQTVDDATRESAAVAAALVEQRMGIQESAEVIVNEDQSVEAIPQASGDGSYQDPAKTGNQEGIETASHGDGGANIAQIDQAHSSDSSLLTPEKINASVIQTVSWVEGVTMQGVQGEEISKEEDNSQDSPLLLNKAKPTDPYPERDTMSFKPEEEEESIELGDAAEVEEITMPRLTAAPRGSLSSAPKRKRGVSAPYDQASGLRTARARVDHNKSDD
jgi:Fe-S-cluster containining protein